MTWVEWSDWFVRLFALTDKQAPTVAGWVSDVFVPGGMTPGEVRAAALIVLEDGPPQFLSEVPAKLFAALRQSRASELMARDDQDRRGGLDVTKPGPCRDCDGSGWAVVPQWPQPAWAKGKMLATMAVACGCGAGVRMASLAEDVRKRGPMGLAGYEAQRPDDWREERDWWRERLAAEGQVGVATAEWEGLVERLLRRARRG